VSYCAEAVTDRHTARRTTSCRADIEALKQACAEDGY
jgi:hypothetical protein